VVIAMLAKNTKNKILELLEKNRGESISGEDIAKMLNVSRNAVWKAVNSLKKEGYGISSANNRGYALLPGSDILSVAGILPYLNENTYASNIHIYDTLESTNKTAKEMAVSGCDHGTIVIANTQTSGKGRYKRGFYSPPDSGLYMSFVFRAEILRFQNPSLITASVAVVVCRAIEAVSEKRPKIKWINDIFIEDKKICGILTEAVTDFESGSIDWIVVGIGINVGNKKDDFPAELAQIAGSIFSGADEEGKKETAARNRLAAEIINRCFCLKTWLDDETVYSEYRERSMLLGRRITVTLPDEAYEADAIDVDINGHLVVRKNDGETVSLPSGKISINLTKLP